MITTIAHRSAEALTSSNRLTRALARVLIYLFSFHWYGRQATNSYTYEFPGGRWYVSALDIIGKDKRTSHASGRVRAIFKARYLRGLLVLAVMK